MASSTQVDDEQHMASTEASTNDEQHVASTDGQQHIANSTWQAPMASNSEEPVANSMRQVRGGH